MSKYRGIIILVLLAFAIGFMIGLPDEPKRTCETVERDQLAFQQCLRYQPGCEHAGLPEFQQYFENRDWLEANCPESDSGDGFLSQ